MQISKLQSTYFYCGMFAAATTQSFQHSFDPNTKLILFNLVSGGSGAGGAFADAAGSTTTPGSGGQPSGAPKMALVPWFLLPPTIQINLPGAVAGGTGAVQGGAAATAGTASTAATITTLALPSTTTLFIGSTSTGGGASTTSAAGTPGNTTVGAVSAIGVNVNATFNSGAAGSTTTTGNSGASTTVPWLSGGGGGAGITTTNIAANGGGMTGAGIFPTLTYTGSRPDFGRTIIIGHTYYGTVFRSGEGGGSSNGANGINGADGGPGCGGGGGGAAHGTGVQAGNGGRGGPACCFVTEV